MRQFVIILLLCSMCLFDAVNGARFNAKRKRVNKQAMQITTARSSTTGVVMNAIPQIELNFDTTSLNKFELILNWNTVNVSDTANDTAGNERKFDRFYLLETMRKFNKKNMTYYNESRLINNVILNTDRYVPRGFKDRLIKYGIKSELNCTYLCLNSSTILEQYSTKRFDCKIHYYSQLYKSCTLFAYDYEKQTSTTPEQQQSVTYIDDNPDYDFFMDKCDFEGFEIDPEYMCKEIPDYTNQYVIKIQPDEDYQFSVAIRDTNAVWSGIVTKEFKYVPNITLSVIGQLSLGKSVKIVCDVDFDRALIDIVKWSNLPIQATKNYNEIIINELKADSHNLNITCEVKYGLRFNYAKSLKKSIVLNLIEFEDFNVSNLKLKIQTDVKDKQLNVSFNLTLSPTNAYKLNPDKILFKVSEDDENYGFVKKYIPFTTTPYDYTNAGLNQVVYLNATDAEDCATKCLLSNNCNHFVFKQPIKLRINNLNSNCDLVHNTVGYTRYIGCQLFTKCFNLIPYDELMRNKEFLSVDVLPNTNYTFDIQIKDKVFNWVKKSTEPQRVYIPLSIEIDFNGSMVLDRANRANEFEIYCKANLTNKNTLPFTFKWFKDGTELKNSKAYTISNRKNVSHLNSYLKFNLSNTNQDFDGYYYCMLNLTSNSLKQSKPYSSDVLPVELKFRVPYTFELVQEAIQVPKLPGALFQLACVVDGYPYVDVYWKVDGKIVANRPLNDIAVDLDETFSVARNIAQNSSQTIIISHLNNPKPLSLYECYFNQTILVKQYNMTVIENDPKIEVKVDTSDLNNLKVYFDINLISKTHIDALNELEHTPLRYRISYTYADQNEIIYDAENFTTPLNPYPNDTVYSLIGFLPSIQNIQSCKLACLYNPYCDFYKYLHAKRHCFLLTFNSTTTKFRSLMDAVITSLTNTKKHLNGILFTDSHQNIDADTESEIDQAYSVLNTCEFGTDIQAVCTAFMVSDFSVNPFVVQNLHPNRKVSFKIEAINPFGKAVFYTKEINVPFPNIKITSNSSNNSLQCEIDIENNLEKFKFKWFKNSEELSTGNNSTYEIIEQNGVSRIILKQDYMGYYVCAAIFIANDLSYVYAKNASYYLHDYYGPLYNVSESMIETVELNGKWDGYCSAEGWPLPNIQWFYNSEPITQSDDATENLTLNSINYHHHSKSFSHLYIKNFTQDNVGVYTCVVNGTIVLKNVSLIVDDVDSEPVSIDSNNDSINLTYSVAIPLLGVFVGTILATSVFIYLKKKRHDNLNRETNLRYSQMQDETMNALDGVDNMEALNSSQIEILNPKSFNDLNEDT